MSDYDDMNIYVDRNGTAYEWRDGETFLRRLSDKRSWPVTAVKEQLGPIMPRATWDELQVKCGVMTVGLFGGGNIGPCRKVAGHVARNEEWHIDDAGCEWKSHTNVTVITR